MRTKSPYLLLYDGDCRVCTAFARCLAFIDIHRSLRARPIQESRSFLQGMSEDTMFDAAHAVAPDGRVTTGADAMPTLAGALLGTPNAEAWLRGSPATMRTLTRGYAILVRLRGQLTCGIAAPSSATRSPR